MKAHTTVPMTEFEATDMIQVKMKDFDNEAIVEISRYGNDSIEGDDLEIIQKLFEIYMDKNGTPSIDEFMSVLESFGYSSNYLKIDDTAFELDFTEG